MTRKRAAAPLLVAAVAATALALAPPAEARSRPDRGGSSGPVARIRPSTPPGARAAARPAPGSRVARGRATYGRTLGFVGFHHHGFFRPWWWYADFWWWGWPYGYPYGYPWVGAYPYYGPPVYGEVYGAPAVVELDVTPGSAVVELDGEEVGFARDYSGAWDRLELPPGRHTIVLSAPGHKTLRIELDAKPGSFHRLGFRLEEGEGTDPRSTAIGESRARRGPAMRQEIADAPGRAFLAIRVEPRDAAVYLDGKFVGSGGELARLHGALPVFAGSHRIEAVRPGYRSEVRDVTVEADGRLELDLALEKEAD